VKELENEKACLTTSLKILYQDFHQSHEHCSNKQEVAASTDNNLDFPKSAVRGSWKRRTFVTRKRAKFTGAFLLR
jgi:hypothetical protein